MMAIIAAVCFVVAFLFEITGTSFGTFGAFAAVCLGLIFLALAHSTFAGRFGGRGDGNPLT